MPGVMLSGQGRLGRLTQGDSVRRTRQRSREIHTLPLWLPDVPEDRGFATVDFGKATAAGLPHRPVAEALAAALTTELRPGLERQRRAGLDPCREAQLLDDWHSSGRTRPTVNRKRILDWNEGGAGEASTAASSSRARSAVTITATRGSRSTSEPATGASSRTGMISASTTPDRPTPDPVSRTTSSASVVNCTTSPHCDTVRAVHNRRYLPRPSTVRRPGRRGVAVTAAPASSPRRRDQRRYGRGRLMAAANASRAPVTTR